MLNIQLHDNGEFSLIRTLNHSMFFEPVTSHDILSQLQEQGYAQKLQVELLDIVLQQLSNPRNVHLRLIRIENGKYISLYEDIFRQLYYYTYGTTELRDKNTTFSSFFKSFMDAVQIRRACKKIMKTKKPDIVDLLMAGAIGLQISTLYPSIVQCTERFEETRMRLQEMPVPVRFFEVAACVVSLTRYEHHGKECPSIEKERVRIALDIAE